MSASLEDRKLNVCAKVSDNCGKKLHTFLIQYIGSKEETKMAVMEVEMVTGGNIKMRFTLPGFDVLIPSKALESSMFNQRLGGSEARGLSGEE